MVRLPGLVRVHFLEIVSVTALCLVAPAAAFASRPTAHTFCASLVAAERRLPPDTDLLTWPSKVNFRGLKRPYWRSPPWKPYLNQIAKIRAFELDPHGDPVHPANVGADKEFSQARLDSLKPTLIEELKSHRLTFQTTQVDLGSNGGLSIIFRIGETGLPVGTVGDLKSPGYFRPLLWKYMLVSSAKFTKYGDWPIFVSRIPTLYIRIFDHATYWIDTHIQTLNTLELNVWPIPGFESKCNLQYKNR